jgi:hypothetical protein
MTKERQLRRLDQRLAQNQKLITRLQEENANLETKRRGIAALPDDSEQFNDEPPVRQ